MLAILSPAKNMRTAPQRDAAPTVPARMDETRALYDLVRDMPAYELESAMQISPQLALRAAADFAAWQPEGGAPAILAYDGLAYKNLDADTLTDDDLRYAQEHLRIISSFYGALRPLDAVRPYRLELCRRPRGQNLYRFWGSKIHDDVFAAGQPVINLASAEYSRAVTAHLRPDETFLTCEFLTYRGGKLRCLAAVAKMARGAMARYIIQNRIDDPAGLVAFDGLGFSFDPNLSHSGVITFVQQ